MDLRTGGLHKLVVNQGVVTMVTVVEWFILAPETNSIRKPERELFRLSYYHNLMCEGKSPDSSLFTGLPRFLFFGLHSVTLFRFCVLYSMQTEEQKTGEAGELG